MGTSDNGLRIRSAGADDASTLADLLTELGFANTAQELLPRLARLQADGERVLVAERDGLVVGLIALHVMLVLHRPAPVGRITTLVIAPDFRGKGIGSALVEAAEQQLVDRGCGLLEVTSNLRLTDAHGFYERCGYARTSLRFAKRPPGTD